MTREERINFLVTAIESGATIITPTRRYKIIDGVFSVASEEFIDNNFVKSVYSSLRDRIRNLTTISINEITVNFSEILHKELNDLINE